MKKISLTFIVLTIIFLFCSCDQANLSTTNNTTISSQVTTVYSDESTILNSSTSTETQMNIIDTYSSFMREVSISDDLIELIVSSPNQIAYFDDEYYIYYGYGEYPASFSRFYVRNLQEGYTNEYDTLSSSDYQILTYDSDNHIIYYVQETNFITSIPSTSINDEEIRIFNTTVSKQEYFASDYVLAGNTFVTYRGEILFSVKGTIIYPHTGIGEDIIYYTYMNDDSNDTCTINSYEGFGGQPSKTLTLKEGYRCYSDYYKRKQKNYIIPLSDGIHLEGLVAIYPDGNINTLYFSEAFSDFKYFGFNSLDNLSVSYNGFIRFDYVNASGDTVQITTDYYLENLYNVDTSMSREYEYGDNEYLVKEYNSNNYGLFNTDIQLIHTFSRLKENNQAVQLYRFEDYILYREIGDLGYTKLISYNTSNDSESVHYVNGYNSRFQVQNYLIYTEGEIIKIYDFADDLIISTELSGETIAVNENYILIHDDEYVYICNLKTGDNTKTTKVGNYKVDNIFLVEFEGKYYIIG